MRSNMALVEVPEIADTWDSGKNGPLSPTLSAGSEKKVWWVGMCGHGWEATPRSRVRGGTGCPFCAPRGRKRLLSGFNDLATTHPGVASHWSPRNPKGPEHVLPRSNSKAWWICSRCGKEWEALISSRTRYPYRGENLCRNCAARGPRTPKNGNSLSDRQPSLAREISVFDPEAVMSGSKTKAPWVCVEGHTWVADIDSRSSGRGCPICWAKGRSGGEFELADFVSTLRLSVERGNKSILSGRELDIVVPSRQVAIEFNGVHWHSDKYRGRNYHLQKSVDCEGAGYQLIHVWEDDWRDRREIVETMLKRKLGVSDEPRLNARSLSYRQVSVADSVSFLESNHIQGRAGGSWRGGLFDGDSLVALMLMKRRSEGHYELTRFATSAVVRGGHSKLLKRAIEELQPESIVTFADRGVSDGGVYAACGFVRDGEIPPDYSYLVRDSRVHKFNYRKARFKSDPELKYVEGLTERQLAELNGLSRVYDAGKVRWVWSAKTPSK